MVQQQEKKGKKTKAKVCGRVKAAVLEGNERAKDLVVASCYDQKPFYMLSNCVEEISWVLRSRRVFSQRYGTTVDFQFLRWSLSDYYNFEMNDNNLADHLRLQYRFMRLQRNYKWWWALWQWAFEVSIVNAYVMMRRYCVLKGVSPPWNHHDFNEAIGKVLFDPDHHWPTHFKLHFNNLSHQSSSDTDTSSSSSRSKRSVKMTDGALDSKKGSLRLRLHSVLPHMCVPVENTASHAICQLHRWAHRKRVVELGLKGINHDSDVLPGRKQVCCTL